MALPLAEESFSYDGAGRLTEDGSWTYAWDAAGHLTGLTRKENTAADPQVVAETISYSYDCDGRRTGRTHRLTTGVGDAQTITTKVSKVLWDGWLPVCEERTLNGTAQTKRWFVWGPDVSGSLGGAGGIGGLVSIREEGGRTLLPVDDGLGNIMAVVDSAGAIVASYDYGPYGELLGASGEVDACPFGYQSKWWDAEAGLSYFGYRRYSPRLGRWLSRDPMGEDGGMNLYAYCEGDPVNKYDYLGMEPVEAIYRDDQGDLIVSLMHRVVDGVPQVRYSDWANWYGPVVGGARKTWWQPASEMEKARFFRPGAGGWELGTEGQRIDMANQQANDTMPEAMRRAQSSSALVGQMAVVAAAAPAAAGMALTGEVATVGSAFLFATEVVGVGTGTVNIVTGSDYANTPAGLIGQGLGAPPLTVFLLDMGNGIGAGMVDGRGPALKMPEISLSRWNPRWNPFNWTPDRGFTGTGGIVPEWRYVGPNVRHVDLTEFRSAHILNRHRAGTGMSGKTEFPATWSDQEILHHISDVATDPAAVTGMGKWNSPYAIGIRGGIEIRVDFYPTTHPIHAGKISTAYPINVLPNP